MDSPIPTANHSAYVGSQVAWTLTSSSPLASPANQAALSTSVPPATTTSARPGRQRRPRATATTSGSTR